VLTQFSALPFEQTAIVLAITLAFFLIAPALVERVGLPGIVGIVLVGAALGPNGTGVLEHSAAVVLLGEAGLLYLLFLVGLDLDLTRFLDAPEDPALFGLASFGIPFVVGTVICIVVLDLGPWAAALLAAVFASHTLLSYPVINKLNLSSNDAVSAVFGGIVFTDTLALVVLAIALGGIDGGVSVAMLGQIALSLVVVFGGLLFVVPRLARWFFATTTQESYFEFLFVAAVLFAAAGLAEGLGLAGILGAFVAGLAINRQIPRSGTLMSRIQFFGNAFFIPFFLFHVGMLIDPAVLAEGGETLWIAGVILGAMFATKAAAAGGVAAIRGYGRDELGVIFGLSVGQAAAALAITLLGLEAGVFTVEVLNAVVIMILVSAVVSPWVTERYGRRLTTNATLEPDPELAESYDPRVLLPLSPTTDPKPLLQLAFVLKDTPASTPLYLLTVLPPAASDDRVDDAEANLGSAAGHASAAEVPVETDSRRYHNPASGIVGASDDSSADLVLTGWPDERSLREVIFDDMSDQVRQRSAKPLIVAELERPINATTNVLFVLPPEVGYHDGFDECVYLVKRLAKNLGVPLRALAVGDHPSPAEYEELVRSVGPNLNASVTGVDDWDELRERLRDADRSDLVVLMEVSQGGVGWSDELRTLSEGLPEFPPDAFLVVTPAEDEPEYGTRFLQLE
jgi:Kef-type K+ transport system membrane component KefB